MGIDILGKIERGLQRTVSATPGLGGLYQAIGGESASKAFQGALIGQDKSNNNAAGDDLELETKIKKKARELAFGSLVQTSSTGAGSPQTQRAKVLGV